MASTTVRVAINGLGRIGRTVLRAWSLGRAHWPGIEIVALNDIAEPAECAHLFEYDSVFGPFPGRVAHEPGWIEVNGHRMRLTQVADLSQLDLSDVDVVMECTGKADSIEMSGRGLAAGARRVLISGPSPAAEFSVVTGVNEAGLSPAMRVVSNASCTTNALAPVLKVLDEAFGVESGFMTTIHCYTGSQPTVDAPRGDPARSRAAALSMVPTTTSAGRLVDLVLPHLAGRVRTAAVRVPVASVSAIDLHLVTARPPASAGAANAVLREAGGVIGWTDRPLVSSDLRARPESVVIALPETAVGAGGLLRVFGWYDNEWGFSCRMLDVAARWGAQTTMKG
jgi:glyceraldehyde 3-phosphate dehydrogenase